MWKKAKQMLKLRTTTYLQLVLTLQVMTIITFVLDVPVARQFFAFIFLTFAPGLIILNLMNLEKLDFAKIIAFSVGLSLTLVMVIGLAINGLYTIFGIVRPLSTTSLFITMNLIIFGLSLYCLKGKKPEDQKFSVSYPQIRTLIFLLLFIFLPILSILGTLLSYSYGNNFLLILMLIIIPVLFLVHEIFSVRINSIFYLLILFIICFSAIFPNWLVSNYVIDWDQHQEYYVFELANLRERWSSAPAPFADLEILKSNQMLSDTILPLIYSRIMGLDGTWIFKIFYPFIISMIPIALYALYGTQVEKKFSFLACLLFISNVVSFGGISSKQAPAMLFFVLLAILMFEKEIPSTCEYLLFLILSAGLIMSHYGTSYIYLFIISLLWVYTLLTRSQKQRVYFMRSLLFFVMAFSWYIFVSHSASFDALTGIISNIIRSLSTEFFNPESRSKEILYHFNPALSVEILHLIGRVLFYAIEFFTILGVIKLALRKEKSSFNWHYAIISLIMTAILALNAILPAVAGFYRVERFWITALVFLSPICVFGGESFFRFLFKRKNRVSILALTLTFMVLFLFQSEVMYEIYGEDTWSVPLSMRRMDPIRLSSDVTFESEVAGAKWLSQNINFSAAEVYSDYISATHVLSSYGMMGEGYVQFFYNTTRLSNNQFLYLGKLNVVNGIFPGPYFAQVWNVSQTSASLNYTNKIYCNGGSEIYQGSG